MPQLIVTVSFALSMGVLLVFLGMFLDYLHERRDTQGKHRANS
jgi:accessory gene regulator protein AgrB